MMLKEALVGVMQRQHLRREERDIQIVPQGGIYKVHVGPYNSRKDADKVLEALKTRFVGAFVVEKKP